MARNVIQSGLQRIVQLSIFIGVLTSGTLALSNLAAAQAPSLVQGTPSRERPEIGWFSNGCTATLILPNVALTASHCLGSSHDDGTVPQGWSVRFNDANGQGHAFPVDRVASLMKGWCDVPPPATG